ncbi:unnamed protein product [Rotaria socialis]|nr:unnamed protein product [Rotaria socialis]
MNGYFSHKNAYLWHRNGRLCHGNGQLCHRNGRLCHRNGQYRVSHFNSEGIALTAFLTKLIADLIIHNFLPLSIVESPYLQAIFHELEPSYVIPKRRYFMKNIFDIMYSQVKQNVYNELQLDSSICLTTDIWTSQVNQAYMTVTAHIVDLDASCIKNFVFETTEFARNHTAERIVERLEEICIEWSIGHKVICLVSDTCNTMRRVGLVFGKGSN